MNLIDLSHPLAPGMPVYPGTDPLVLEQAAELSRHGFAEKRLTLTGHTGTHLDVPAHVLASGPGLDSLALDRFAGTACVVDVRACGGRAVTVEDLLPQRRRMAKADFVLLRTGFERHWGSPDYFRGYPYLSPEAARFLASFPLKGLGLDAPSPDPVDCAELTAHRILLAAGFVLVENLRCLGILPQDGFRFLALPLPIAGGDGSPVRAAALLGED